MHVYANMVANVATSGSQTLIYMLSLDVNAFAHTRILVAARISSSYLFVIRSYNILYNLTPIAYSTAIDNNSTHYFSVLPQQS